MKIRQVTQRQRASRLSVASHSSPRFAHGPHSSSLRSTFCLKRTSGWTSVAGRFRCLSDMRSHLFFACTPKWLCFGAFSLCMRQVRFGCCACPFVLCALPLGGRQYTRLRCYLADGSRSPSFAAMIRHRSPTGSWIDVLSTPRRHAAALRMAVNAPWCRTAFQHVPRRKIRLPANVPRDVCRRPVDGSTRAIDIMCGRVSLLHP